MSLDSAIYDLIGDVYAAPADDTAGLRVLEAIRQRTGSRFLLVSAVDLECRQYSRTYWHGADDSGFLDGMAEYEQQMFQHDPLLAVAAQFPEAGFAESHDALARLGRSPENDPFIDFTIGKMGSRANAVCYSKPRDGVTLGLSINLPSDRARFDPQQLGLFRMLFGHIQRASWLAARPPHLDTTQEAQVFLNDRGLVLAMSRSAEDILAVGDGLTVRGRRLAGARTRDNHAIDALVARTLDVGRIGGGGGTLALPRPSGEPAWLLTADYLGSRFILGGALEASVLIRIVQRPSDHAASPGDRIIKLFGLTPTEAKIIEGLYAENLELRGAAEQVGVTYSTARVHLRNILAKSSTINQVELMRLLERIMH